MLKNICYLPLLIIALACNGTKPIQSTMKILPAKEYAIAIKTDPSAYVIDVRTPEEYATGHIEGAQLIDVMDDSCFVATISALKPHHTYYIYCRSGRRSQKAAQIMTEKGLKVVDLQGGYTAWASYKNQK